MIRNSKFAAAITALTVIASPASTAVARPTNAAGARLYDGAWSVVIQTNRGNCPADVRAAVRISGGQLLAGDPSYQINGRVTPGGTVHVTVSAGGQGAGGSGRLAHNFGSGLWKTFSGECAGQWTAQRRG